MNDAEWQVVERYVDRLRHSLLLGHWRIGINRDPPTADGGEPGDDQSMIDGQMEIQRDSAIAELRLHANFRDGDPEGQRETIVHELLHLHFDALFSDMYDTISRLASLEAGTALNMLNRRSYERMTQAVAAAIAPRYDLIDWSLATQQENGPMGDKAQGQGSERGRSEEAHDPNRPIDPATGEKEGLGPRDDAATDAQDATPATEADDTAADEAADDNDDFEA